MFYRNIIAIFAAACLSTHVLAATDTTKSTTSTTSQATTQSSSSTQQTKVNINTASLEQLMGVKGMSKLKAKNIVRYRTQHLFKSLDELSSVRGFKRLSPENLKSIQNQLSID